MKPPLADLCPCGLRTEDSLLARHGYRHRIRGEPPAAFHSDRPCLTDPPVSKDRGLTRTGGHTHTHTRTYIHTLTNARKYTPAHTTQVVISSIDY